MMLLLEVRESPCPVWLLNSNGAILILLLVLWAVGPNWAVPSHPHGGLLVCCLHELFTESLLGGSGSLGSRKAEIEYCGAGGSAMLYFSNE